MFEKFLKDLRKLDVNADDGALDQFIEKSLQPLFEVVKKNNVKFRPLVDVNTRQQIQKELAFPEKLELAEEDKKKLQKIRARLQNKEDFSSFNYLFRKTLIRESSVDFDKNIQEKIREDKKQIAESQDVLEKRLVRFHDSFYVYVLGKKKETHPDPDVQKVAETEKILSLKAKEVLDAKIEEVKQKIIASGKIKEESDILGEALENIEKINQEENEKINEELLEKLKSSIQLVFQPVLTDWENIQKEITKENYPYLLMEKEKNSDFFHFARRTILSELVHNKEAGEESRPVKEILREAEQYVKEKREASNSLHELVQKLDGIPINPLFYQLIEKFLLKSDVYGVDKSSVTLAKSLAELRRTFSSSIKTLATGQDSGLENHDDFKRFMTFWQDSENHTLEKLNEFFDRLFEEKTKESIHNTSSLDEIWETLVNRLENIDKEPIYFLNTLMLLESSIREELEINVPNAKISDQWVKYALEKFIESKKYELKDEKIADKLFQLEKISGVKLNFKDDTAKEKEEKDEAIPRMNVAARALITKISLPENYNKSKFADLAHNKNPMLPAIQNYFNQGDTFLYDNWKKNSRLPWWKFWAKRTQYTLDIDDAVREYSDLSKKEKLSLSDKLDKLYLIKITTSKYIEDNTGGTRITAVENLSNLVNREIIKINAQQKTVVLPLPQTEKKENDEKQKLKDPLLHDLEAALKDAMDKLGKRIEALEAHGINLSDATRKFVISSATHHRVEEIGRLILLMGAKKLQLPRQVESGKIDISKTVQGLEDEIKEYFGHAEHVVVELGFQPAFLRKMENELLAAIEAVKDKYTHVERYRKAIGGES